MNIYKIIAKLPRNLTGIKDSKCVLFRTFSLSQKLTSDEKKSEESPLKKLLDESATFEDLRPQTQEQQWATLPYPQGTKIRKQGESFIEKPKHDPRESTIILFPGQGSQFVGMAKDLLKYPMARDLFELANYILNYDLLKLCLEGPKDKLDQTKYSQPAIMVSSLAAIERLKEERPKAIESCVATAGFSLGEITALVFAGAIGFERGLKLVQIRGEAMQLACEAYKGGMVTVMYNPDSKLNQAIRKAKEWATDKGDLMPECQIANYLYPHCKVIAGSESALDYLEKNAKEYNLKKVKRLAVSGAFHSNLMLPAVEPFRKALNKSEINNPVISVYSNVDGKRYKDAQHIKKQLPKQIVKPVKWEQLLHVVYERSQGEYFPRTFECGPGTSLRAILKQVNAKAWTTCFNILV
ncbi:probable malonyl-CoA-acyl carrier protein transacylase, mitochondrial [Tribolium madens]|uniref:probable malonyl-CoA-acyl carrier protein transacylase, mitochondrial n=1 Tax=Tribolium madens TaxID=41895 RepID=UPI001CF72D27|nr:probable malonyl-CoA-acyl carrier protein transacylase, mitochondrial [Tribolium madens]